MTWSDLFPPAPPMPTPDPVLVSFYAGASALECLMAGLFFLRFWRRTNERLFLAFAFAFWLLGANAAIPVLLGRPTASHGEVYLLRLAAFVLIILAILGKNVWNRKP